VLRRVREGRDGGHGLLPTISCEKRIDFELCVRECEMRKEVRRTRYAITGKTTVTVVPLSELNSSAVPPIWRESA